MPELIIIAAIAQNRALGRNNQLLWHLPADLRHFKKLTIGQVVLMGRRTYESIGRPLPNRINVVITRNRDFHPQGVEIFHSLQEAIKAKNDCEKLYIAGGADIYRQALPLAHRMELTIVHRDYDADTWFPEWNPDEWETQNTQQITDRDSDTEVQLTFLSLIRKQTTSP
ncbi:dihydrofolate reductase [Schleiferia thermophila]|uniref:Dihydrofolate reductase n=1 Tax=Schleiferia thermophila TaxID=884107 RepID=A0A368ZYU6_9FLAO|nr:dihydrofolate reductase [Schleiferia thermophila]RCX02113.1 dihydrofolate reductase [Schleiferia thermophila]GCD80633.1 dihydrofolate reductase [Schleiferia thermophila]